MTDFDIFKSCFPWCSLTEELFSELSERENCHIISEEGGAAYINKNKITFMAVHPDYQGKGIGKRLLMAAEAYIKSIGYDYVRTGGIFPSLPVEVRGFFEKNGYKTDEIYSEMGMNVKGFIADSLPTPENVTFGYYNGSFDELIKVVAAVDEEWVQYFSEDSTVFCGYRDGELASFCIAEESVSCLLSDGKNKVGSIGCVGTQPDFRKQGIGLRMVELATEDLAAKGADKCFIHWTSLTDWYGRLGYRTFLDFIPAEKKL